MTMRELESIFDWSGRIVIFVLVMMGLFIGIFIGRALEIAKAQTAGVVYFHPVDRIHIYTNNVPTNIIVEIPK